MGSNDVRGARRSARSWWIRPLTRVSWQHFKIIPFGSSLGTLDISEMMSFIGVPHFFTGEFVRILAINLSSFLDIHQLKVLQRLAPRANGVKRSRVLLDNLPYSIFT